MCNNVYDDFSPSCLLTPLLKKINYYNNNPRYLLFIGGVRKVGEGEIIDKTLHQGKLETLSQIQ